MRYSLFDSISKKYWAIFGRDFELGRGKLKGNSANLRLKNQIVAEIARISKVHFPGALIGPGPQV